MEFLEMFPLLTEEKTKKKRKKTKQKNSITKDIKNITINFCITSLPNNDPPPKKKNDMREKKNPQKTKR